VEDIKNVIIWGNHSLTQYPDLNHGTVTVNGQAKNLKQAINDDAYV